MQKKQKIYNKNLKLTSRNWLNRHINDTYVQRAKTEGYICRSAYKLLEIDEKFKLINQNIKTVIDLGASPGGWTQVISKRLFKYGKSFRIFSLDIKDMNEMPNVLFIKADCLNTDEVINKLQLSSVELILSDMSPSSCGDPDIDHIRIIELAKAAYRISIKLLKSNGMMVLKIFQGSEEREFINSIMENFKAVKYFKPKSSYKNNREIYIIAYKK
jgi:23S rRNA (uridine2552-2'-O)-methyltransferase